MIYRLFDKPNVKLTTCELIAKFHYTDTDPNGPARTQRSFAAKKSVSVSVSVSGLCPCPV